jgi:hypothetical protein
VDLPGIRGVDDAGDIRRKLVVDDLGEGDMFKDRAQAGTCRDPDLLEVLGRPLVRHGLRTPTPNLGEWTIHGANHIGHRDEMRRSTEPVAAGAAALTLDKT